LHASDVVFINYLAQPFHYYLFNSATGIGIGYFLARELRRNRIFERLALNFRLMRSNSKAQRPTKKDLLLEVTAASSSALGGVSGFHRRVSPKCIDGCDAYGPTYGCPRNRVIKEQILWGRVLLCDSRNMYSIYPGPW
jgi:hypothetical protein